MLIREHALLAPLRTSMSKHQKLHHCKICPCTSDSRAHTRECMQPQPLRRSLICGAPDASRLRRHPLISILLLALCLCACGIGERTAPRPMAVSCVVRQIRAAHVRSGPQIVDGLLKSGRTLPSCWPSGWCDPRETPSHLDHCQIEP